MAEDDLEEAPAPAKKKLPGKVIVLFVVAPLAALLLVGAIFMFMLGGGEDKAEETKAEAATEKSAQAKGRIDPSELMRYELPEILVNIKTADGTPTYLKLRVTLEVPLEVDRTKLDGAMPRIIDRFQIFLRELRLEDLSGSAASFRLREELLRRVNAAAHPIEIHSVLIQEMIVQ